MKKKRIGIIICMLLIATAIPVMGTTNAIRNKIISDEKNLIEETTPVDICGSATVILLGNETGKIGAKVRFYDMIGPFVRLFRYVDIPVVLVDENYPNELIRDIYFGEYACTFEGDCGRYMAKAICPNGYCGNYTQTFEFPCSFIVFPIEIDNESCPDSVTRSVGLNHVMQSFSNLIERLMNHFPKLAERF